MQGFSGFNPITYQEIKAYNELLEINMSPWEISCIKKMDSIFMTEIAKICKD